MHCVQRHGVRIVAFNKCGHTSIVNAFQTKPGDYPQRGKNKLAIESLVGDYEKARNWDYPIVTIAYFRHPLARLASVWNHLMRQSWYSSFKSMGFERDMTFPQFLEKLLQEKGNYLDPHVKHQHLNFRECRGWLGDTWIARLDEIATVWPQMVRTWDLDCTTNIAHFNREEYPAGLPWTSLYVGHEQLAFDLLKMYDLDLHIWRNRAIV